MHANLDFFFFFKCFLSLSGKQPWTVVFSESPVAEREEQL